MPRSIVLVTLILVMGISSATNRESSPITPIRNLFDAMRDKDALKIEQQFIEGAALQRAQNSGEILNNDISDFAKRIAASEKYLDEQLFNVKVFREGPLATAWTPFLFYIDGELSHCGVNTFQLVEVNGIWKIQSIIDVLHQGDCEDFKASKQ